MNTPSTWRSERGGVQGVAFVLLSFLVAERLLLILGQPDLLHDLDLAELKHMGFAMNGLPTGEGLRHRLLVWLSGPENLHHGGYPVVSLLFAALAKLFGATLQTLRLIPATSAVAAAVLMAVWLRRRAGGLSALLALGLLAGAPLLFLKWSCTARGGHTEAVVFVPLVLLLFDRALHSKGGASWFVAGAVSGFAVYFSYLALPLVVLLSVGALWDGRRLVQGSATVRFTSLMCGGLVGFLPWILGLLVLGVPYLEATIHQSPNPNETGEVFTRGVFETLRGTLVALPHNLWPWTFSEALAPAYGGASDLLDYRPTRTDWLIRGLILSTGVLGILAGLAKRSALVLALALLPGVHLLFVMRLANPGAWPEIPHRYLLVAFPAVVASSALGVSWLLEGSGKARQCMGVGLALALGTVSVCGILQHSRWLKSPDFEALREWNVGSYFAEGIGQVRLEEGPEINRLLAGFSGPTAGVSRRGVGLIYALHSDFYLLWRRPGDRDVPYPDALFRDPDPLTGHPGEASALVLGAYEATRTKSRGNVAQRSRWLCSWTPGPQFSEEVAALFAEREPRLDCSPPP